MIVFLNGRFLPEEEAKVSTFDHGFLFGDGVYETLRTYGGKIWKLDKHLERLQDSARLLDIPLPWSLTKIGAWVVKAIKLNGFPESRVRITLTRGINGYNFSRVRKPTFCIQVKELRSQPARVYERGVSVVTFKMERFLAKAKTTNMLPMILAQQHMKKMKAYETIFVSEKDWVREGSMTNIFIVKGTALLTPKTNVLPGITRAVIQKLGRKVGLKVKVVDFRLSELYKADEVFITNTTREVVPVVEVDGRKIGNGKPGGYAIELRKVFRVYVQKF